MSAASTPAPRTKSSNSPRPSGSRYSLFWPVLIFLFGAGALALYQVVSMEDQLDQLTQNIDKLDTRVQRAQYEKNKFYAIAKDVLRLAPKNPNAEAVATYFKLHQLQEAQPELMSLSEPSPVANTNSAFVTPPPAPTNAPPATAPIPSPAVK